MDFEAGLNGNGRKYCEFGFLFIILLCLLNGCSISSIQTSTDKHSFIPKKHNLNRWKIPISVPEGDFFKVCGWMSNNEILYLANKGKTSNLYLYNLVLGKSTLIYHSPTPIKTAEISPTKKYIFILSSPSTENGAITIIDRKGAVLWKINIPSYELDFAWNPYNESQILLTKFNEEWAFQVFQLDIFHKTIKLLEVPQPFLKWIDSDAIGYLDLNKSNQTMIGPLMKIDLQSEKTQKLCNNIYQFFAFKNMLMTITIDKGNAANAIYMFYDERQHTLFSFSMPQQKKDSDWLVPYNDYIDSTKQFLTFQPMEGSLAASNNNGFELDSYQLKTGKKEILFKKLDNEPILCSPSGNACLYGMRFEKVIDLKSKKIVDLVKE